MDDTVKTVPVMEGLPVEEMDALMRELLGNRNAAPTTETFSNPGQQWDTLTLLTGGFVPVGSIFWARPPKIFSQQKILLAMDEADKAAQNESAIQGLIEQSNILCKLAASLFYVRDSLGEFRQATEAEIGGDEVGLNPTEIKDALLKLMGMSSESETEGNAQSRPTS